MTFLNGFSAKLATRSRHVCAFFGAGTSKACGLPDVQTLQQQIVDELQGEQREVFERQLGHRDLEQVLSRLRRIAALVEGDDRVDGLNADAATKLDAEVCRIIVRRLNIEYADLKSAYRLAAWAARADYLRPVELFTVNYDLVLETALERFSVPYFDGFVGSLRARFRTDFVEASPGDGEAWLPAFIVRLWKLHGSVHWAWDDGDRAEVVRLGTAVRQSSPAAIYPSDTKYDESRRVPFVVLQDRLRRALHQPETLVLVSGYSWSDEHLNEMLFDAATRRPRSEFIAFCYSTIPAKLAERAIITPNLQAVTGGEAIIGGIRSTWRRPDEEVVPDVWADDKLTLGDFACLASFLARSSPPHSALVNDLEGLLAEPVEDVSA